MMTEKDIEFEIRLLKAMIKIAKEIVLGEKHPIKFYEEIKDKDKITAFIFGVLTAMKNPFFAWSCNNNFEWVINKLKEGKSEEEIVEEFKRKIRDEYLHEYMVYGG